MLNVKLILYWKSWLNLVQFRKKENYLLKSSLWMLSAAPTEWGQLRIVFVWHPSKELVSRGVLRHHLVHNIFFSYKKMIFIVKFKRYSTSVGEIISFHFFFRDGKGSNEPINWNRLPGQVWWKDKEATSQRTFIYIYLWGFLWHNSVKVSQPAEGN